MDQENLIINKMPTFSIINGTVSLNLTIPRSGIRICDDNGNHVSKPVSQILDFNNYSIEWMVTNNDLIEIIRQKFTREEIASLTDELREINTSLKDSDFFNRVAQRQHTNRTIDNFSIYKYEESFYSFEKDVSLNLQVKITFKMGDFTLAPHMFILIRLNNPNIILSNGIGNILTNNALGSGAKCIWSPSNQTTSEITKTLACSSDGHKNDLINLLNRIT